MTTSQNDPLSGESPHFPVDTQVLSSASYIASSFPSVHLSSEGISSAAHSLYALMQTRSYSPSSWSSHALHPSPSLPSTLSFIFCLDVLNFSFWSPLAGDARWGIEYRGAVHRGYWGLVAALRRDQDHGGTFVDPRTWEDVSVVELRRVFACHAAAEEEMPLLEERVRVLNEAGRVLREKYEGKVERLVEAAGGSAGRLVDMLARDFDGFRDEGVYRGRKVRFLKRAQIFVADVWAAYEGETWGAFEDVDCITMFADYRVPQQLHALGCFTYADELDKAVRDQQTIASGSEWEMQLRGCSIWTVELIRRAIMDKHPEAKVNAILIDFFLYDLAKEREAAQEESIPHHRTRSIWY